MCQAGEEAEKGQASFLFAASFLEAPLGGWAACSEVSFHKLWLGGSTCLHQCPSPPGTHGEGLPDLSHGQGQF